MAEPNHTTFTIRRQQFFYQGFTGEIKQAELPDYPATDAGLLDWYSLDHFLFGPQKLKEFPTQAAATEWVVDLVRVTNTGDYAYWETHGTLPPAYQIVPVAELRLPQFTPYVQEMMDELGAPRREHHSETHNLYIVKTDPRNPSHHGLHTNTAPYVLTASPGAGDQIEYVLGGRVMEVYEHRLSGNALQVGGRATLELFTHPPCKPYDSVCVRILSHAGRSAMLGEDGLEDAFDNECAAQLWLETLSGMGQRDWRYAPVSIAIETDPPDNGDADLDFLRWHYSGDLAAAYDPATGRWQIEDESTKQQTHLAQVKAEKESARHLARLCEECAPLPWAQAQALADWLRQHGDENTSEWLTRLWADESRYGLRNAVACTLQKQGYDSLAVALADIQKGGDDHA